MPDRTICSGCATHSEIGSVFWIASHFGASSPALMCRKVSAEKPTAKEMECRSRLGFHMQRGQHRGEQRHKHRLANPAQTEAGHGDAQLGGAQVRVEIAQRWSARLLPADAPC